MKQVKRRKNESQLSIVRKRLGLSQQQLADQLKVSRSLVMMAEGGKRSLPTRALLQVAELEIRLGSEKLEKAPEIPHPAERNSKEKCIRRCEILFAKESSCRLKIRKCLEKIETMTALYIKTREWLNVIEGYLRDYRDEVFIKNTWKKQQQSAIRVLETCNIPNQVMLRHQVKLLESEAALYRCMQEELKNDLPHFFK